MARPHPSSRSAVLVRVCAAVAAAATLAPACSDSTGPEPDPGYRLEWVTAPPGTVREGDAIPLAAALVDAEGAAVSAFDGRPLSVRFLWPTDSQPGTGCPASGCTAVVAGNAASLVVPWLSAGTWTARACASPGTADSLCVDRAVTVAPVNAVLTVIPSDSVLAGQRFALAAALRLPDGTAVPDDHLVRFHVLAGGTALAAGALACPAAASPCARAATVGAVRMDSVTIASAANVTVRACAVAPNGHERCDPAGDRALRVVVGTPILRFLSSPTAGEVTIPFATQPQVEAVYPDGTRRSDFGELVRLSLLPDTTRGVLAGRNHDGGDGRITVTARAAGGLATFADTRVTGVGAGYRLLVESNGAIPDTSDAFAIGPATGGLTLVMTAMSAEFMEVGRGAVVPQRPRATIRGPRGDPAVGVEVSFVTTVGGGSLAKSLDTTDYGGVAEAGDWRVGTAPSVNVVTARAPGADSGTVSVFASRPDHLRMTRAPESITVGDSTSGVAEIQLLGVAGQPLWGATDTVEIRIRRPDSTTIMTSHAAVNGIVTITGYGRGLGLGVHWIVASTLGRDFTIRTEQYFRVRGDPARAQVIAISPTTQTGAAGQPAPQEPVVLVRDSAGTPLQGLEVDFIVMSGGGTVEFERRITSDSGRSRAGAWTLGPAVGDNILRASIVGGSAFVDFTAIVLAPSFAVTTFSAGRNHTCAVAASNGLPYCWGTSSEGQVGDGTRLTRTRPVQIGGGLLQFTQLSAGGQFTCALTERGIPYCWGDNEEGLLGDGSFGNDRLTPVRVAGQHTFASISAGVAHACGREASGTTRCWGYNLWGQLGIDGSGSIEMEPRLLRPFALRLTQVSAGGFHTCGLDEQGRAWCWGLNEYGQVGNGAETIVEDTAVMVAGGRTFTQVSAGHSHTCGLSEGSVYCWGLNSLGQLGRGDTTTLSRVPLPALGALGTTLRISSGGDHTCALNMQGNVYCWGYNLMGQLGDGTRVNRGTAVQVQTPLLFASIDAGRYHTCASRQNGELFCWGENTGAQLGIGNATNQDTPVGVAPP